MRAAGRASSAPCSIWQPLPSGKQRGLHREHTHRDTRRHTQAPPQSPRLLLVLNQPHILTRRQAKPTLLPRSAACVGFGPNLLKGAQHRRRIAQPFLVPPSWALALGDKHPKAATLDPGSKCCELLLARDRFGGGD